MRALKSYNQHLDICLLQSESRDRASTQSARFSKGMVAAMCPKQTLCKFVILFLVCALITQRYACMLYGKPG